jgi:hypothetical protein
MREGEKTLRLYVSYLQQYMLRTFMFIFLVHISQVGYIRIPYLLD